MCRYPDMLNFQRIKMMAVSGCGPFTYDRFRINHDTCVGAWQRCRGVRERYRGVLRITAKRADMPFICCEEEFPY